MHCRAEACLRRAVGHLSGKIVTLSPVRARRGHDPALLCFAWKIFFIDFIFWV